MRAYRDQLVAARPEAIRVNIEYEKTEQKRHQLFFRVPELRLRAHPRTRREAESSGRDLTKAVAIFREVLQRLAGPKGLHTKALLDALIFDLLCPAGLAACKVGYERFEDGQIPQRTGAMIPDPTFQQAPGTVLGLRPAPLIPEVVHVPNVVAEQYYASRISPGHLLVPSDFTGNVYHRDAPWLAYDFWLARHEADRRGWRLPSDLRGSSLDDDDRLVELAQTGSREDQLKCREIWCYAQRIYPGVAHPHRIQRIVFVEGVQEPVLLHDSRDQVFDARGRLTGGIRTLPIKVLTLRYVSDTWCPPSDCEITQKLADELSEGHTMMVVHRRKAIPMREMDIQRVPDERIRTLIQKGEYYDIIPKDGPEPVLTEMALSRFPRENFAFHDYGMASVDRAWAMGANQQGVRETTTRTATELALMQRATENRLSGEQGAVIAFWLEIMETVAQLVQLRADREDYVEIVGEGGARTIEAWDKTTIPGEYLFDVVPDSSARPDAAHDRDLALNRYNLVRNDPQINGAELLRSTLEQWSADEVERLIQAPSPPTERPRISLSLKGENLNPAAPEYPNVLALLAASGIGATLTPETDAPIGPAPVIDRERLRMAEADAADQRAGGLVGVGDRP